MSIKSGNKILVVRFSSIGDIVLTTPIIRCIKLQTGASVHFITKKAYASILLSNPYIDKVHAINKDINELKNTLLGEQFDFYIDLHKNLRSLRLAKALNLKRHSFDKINWQKWLIVNFKINRLPDVHIVDRYFQAVAFADVKNDGQGLDYFIPQEVRVDWKQLLPDFKKENYIAFAIGAAHATKRLPEAKILSIVKKITQPTVLIGGPAERAIGERIVKEGGQNVYNLCGQLSLHQSALVIRDAWKVITHDTGMMHIAAAFQKDIISLWGNTIPQFGMYPYYEKGVDKNQIVEIQGLSCRPCSKIGYDKCPKGHFKCMLEIDEEAILDLL